MTPPAGTTSTRTSTPSTGTTSTTPTGCRNQANASLTKFASGFAGEHNLKFGAEFERSYIKSEAGYTGRYVRWHLRRALLRLPVGRLPEGQHQHPLRGLRAGFVGDRVALTINPGLRSTAPGYNKELGDTVFKTNPVSPRIGFAWDVSGNSRTVVRGHYGWYFDGAKSTYYDLLDPNNAPFFGAYIDEQPEHDQRCLHH